MDNNIRKISGSLMDLQNERVSKSNNCSHNWNEISRGDSFKVQDGDTLTWVKSKCSKCGEIKERMEDY